MKEIFSNTTTLALRTHIEEAFLFKAVYKGLNPTVNGNSRQMIGIVGY